MSTQPQQFSSAVPPATVVEFLSPEHQQQLLRTRARLLARPRTKQTMATSATLQVVEFFVNKDKYASMSDGQKKAVDAHCTIEWAEKVGGPWGEFEFGGHDKLKALPDHEVYSISADQLAEWRKAAAPLETKWADAVKKTGADPKAVKDELTAALTKYGAGL